MRLYLDANPIIYSIEGVLASALLAKADVFLTADQNLTRCADLKVEVLAGPRNAT